MGLFTRKLSSRCGTKDKMRVESVLLLVSVASLCLVATALQGKCPKSHPYAYLNGRYCCADPKAKIYGPKHLRCDTRASCCGPRVNCMWGSCKNYPFSGNCPSSHPHAFLRGEHCCASNLEGRNAAEGVRCNGLKISIGSTCCGGAQIACPHGKRCAPVGQYVPAIPVEKPKPSRPLIGK